MKKLIYLCGILFISTISQAQTLPNANFEDTTSIGVIPFFDNWSGDEYGSGISNDAQSGNFSISVWNWYFYARGYAMNGAHYFYTDAYKSGTPYTQKATSLNGFYRYDTVDTYSNFDSAQITVLLKKRNSMTQQIDTIGFGQIRLPAHAPTDGTFAPFSVAIDDWDGAQQPDSIVVLFQSSVDGFCENSDDGNCLYFNVDELSLVTPLGVTDVNGNILQMELYPNPADQNATILITALKNQALLIQVTDMTGKLIMKISSDVLTGKNTISLPVTELSKGYYFVNLISETEMKTLKLVKE